VIRPALESGAIVLCDRFSDATIAYQGYGRGLDLAMIHALDRLVTAGMLPDLTIVLDVEAAVGLARARGRNNQQGLEAEARFENEALAFHERVRQGYLTLAREAPDRMKIVDAALPPLRVQEKIREIVDRCLI
jgi:dTMP kinase